MPVRDSVETLLAELALSQGRELFRLAFGIVRNSAAAEDAVQQALLRACEHFRQDIPRNARGWVVRTVINESLQMLRRRKVERRVLAQTHRPTATVEPPDEAIESAACVRTALVDLPERTREVVVLRVMLGYSGQETATLLELSASDVSRRLYGGLDSLRAVLRRSEPALTEDCA